jgi:hypothetical protein
MSLKVGEVHTQQIQVGACKVRVQQAKVETLIETNLQPD